VFWNTIDYVLEDIERIEVIRGPGATLWGANAVNGVVNIVTRSTGDTHGTLVSLTSGNEDPAIAEVRTGGGSQAFSYRVYGKYAQRDAQRFSTGESSDDTRRRGQAGLRLDGKRKTDQWMVKADLFHSRDGFADRRDGEWTGAALHGRINRQVSSGDSLQLQAFYRREYRNIERQLTHQLDTLDVDFQHALKRSRHHFIWGAAVRSNRDETYASAVVRFDPRSRSYPLFSAFAQNEFALRPDSVFLTAGIKVEHNAFSGGDWQPNLRARWLVRPNQVLWGSIARAARRPTRFDDDIVVTAPNGLELIRGSDDFESEIMTGAEVGYRARPLPLLSLDVTGFVQDYDRLRSQEAPPVGVIPVTVGNSLTGRSRGVELAVAVQPLSRWRVRFSFTGLSTDIVRAGGSRDVSGGVNEANDPSYFLTLRSGFELPRQIDVDAWLRRVDALPDPAVPAYTELNARVGWRPREALEFAIVGQDLLHQRHPEFGTSVPRRIEFERSLRALLTLRMP
jgi:iron complex outermembrane recepter protein